MISLDPTDTIAAVASPPGHGFRGIVRLSGPAAWAAALSGFTRKHGAAARPPARATRLAGQYRLDGLRPELPASVLLWPGPHTYTGQPLAEVHTVGSPPLVALLLAHALAHGARLAEPGEFTLRAFLSGRIDLTRAEAVLGVIDARNPAQLDAALRQLAGGLFGPIAALRDRLLDVLAHLEANLDFVAEPDVAELGRAELAASLAQSAAEVAALAGRLQARDRPEGLPTVVLVGPPNAGKSRLFNALLGASRALVSAQPGTTRDYIEAVCDCDGMTVALVDTAGAAAARDPIEARAQTLRTEQAARADLLLACLPAGADHEGQLDFAGPPDRPRLLVRTKADLAPEAPVPPGVLATSAATGSGLDALRRAVAAAIRADSRDGDLPATTGARCRDSLLRASDALASASSTLALGGGDELVAVDLRQALDDLGKVVGAVVTDDILDRIFSRFCIGK
jgi:tRNA modification GTPase